MAKIIIIGGVAGGATAAARLRRLDEHAEIILFERGEHISFANCGLPYHIGGVIEDRSDLILQTPQRFHERFHIDVRVNSEVIGIDRTGQTVTVRTQTGETYSQHYDKLILAPGSCPIVPPLPGVDAPGVFTLRSLADADRILAYLRARNATRAVVVGGGYIGVEMAENLSHAGMHVSLVELSAQVIAPLDPDMACRVHHHLRENGVALSLNNGVRAIAQHDGGLHVTLTHGTLTADVVLLAVGVRPDSALARQAGLALTPEGGILVDRTMRTSDAHIYAVGDAVQVTDFVTGQPTMIPLAGPANKQGRIAADNICGIASEYGGTQGSAIVKVFELTAATTGINEKTARQLNLNYDKVFAWLPGHAAYYPGTLPMTLKVLFGRDDGKLLGAQIIGHDGVDKRCDLLAMAIRFGMTAHDLTRLELCYAPPYGAAKDPVNIVGYMIESLLAKRVAQFHWHEVAALPRDGSVTLLDVRTQDEYDEGHIDGFVNLSLDKLRTRIHALPADKPVYLHCQSGVRSYLACRILMQNGFNARHLGGGYRLYHSVTSELGE